MNPHQEAMDINVVSIKTWNMVRVPIICIIEL